MKTALARRALWMGLVFSAVGVAVGHAQAQGLLRGGGSRISVPFLWSDEVIYDEWRVEKHAVIGHYRLMNPVGTRVAFGDFETCLAALDKAKADNKLPPLPQDVVIVLHGLGASRGFMDGICDYLREQGGYYVINVNYPSTMLTIGDYAKSLDSIVRHLDGVKTISFVAHSMGNIVIRKYLKDQEALTPAMRPQVSYRRMVMISPPNHGAEIADRLNSGEVTAQLAEMFAGEPAKELAPGIGWPTLEKQLATPSFEFGIIAGGRGDSSGYLPIIPGDDDSLLSVETMKLEGARDFIQTKGIHQIMPNYNEVRAATLNFLKHGYFVAASATHPIGKPVAGAAPAPAPVATR